MPTSVATATLVDTASNMSKNTGSMRRRSRSQKQPDKQPERDASTNGAEKKEADSMKAYAAKKYRHVAAVHWGPRTSCLDHDSDATPSFLGFRNLMVIVLGTILDMSAVCGGGAN